MTHGRKRQLCKLWKLCCTQYIQCLVGHQLKKKTGVTECDALSLRSINEEKLLSEKFSRCSDEKW